MLKFLIISSFLLTFGNLFSEELPFYLTENYNPRFEYRNFESYVRSYQSTKHNHIQGESRIARRDYDVLSYDLKLDWRNPLSSPTALTSDRYYNGIVDIKLQFTKVTDKLVLDIGKTLFINSIKINGKIIDSLDIRIDRNKEELVISNLVSINTSNTYSFEVDYTYKGDLNYSDRSGFFLHEKGLSYKDRGKTYIVEEKVAYTMSEPQDARLWVVCNDSPHDKAILTSSVTVPEGFIVSSNGKSTITENLDKSRIFNFNHKYPISTYLMTFAASKFDTFSHTFTRKTGELDRLDTNSLVPVNYYFWATDNPTSDTSTQIYNVKKSFKNMVAMMEHFSDKMIPYPFETYGMTAVAPFPYGGMEHQTMTTIHRNWLAGAESGIAHELGHHWFGNLVTCATWQDLWHNEGGATWTEALWAEKVGGKDAYKFYTYRNASNYLNSNQFLSLPAIADVTIPQLFTGVGGPLVYQKAGFVYHMLRALLGDEAFFKTLREFHLAYKFNYIETSDFADFWASKNPNLEIDLKVFIDQFINKPGHPKYELTPLIYDGSNKNIPKVRVKVSQIQSKIQNVAVGTPEVFIGYLDLVMYKDTTFTTSDISRIKITQKDTIIEFPNITYVPTALEALSFDFLCISEDKQAITSIESDEIGDEITVSSHSNGKSPSFSIENLSQGITQIQLLDLNGRFIQTLFESQTEKGTLKFSNDLSDVANGVYFVIVRNNNRMKTTKVSLID